MGTQYHVENLSSNNFYIRPSFKWSPEVQKSTLLNTNTKTLFLFILFAFIKIYQNIHLLKFDKINNVDMILLYCILNHFKYHKKYLMKSIVNCFRLMKCICNRSNKYVMSCQHGLTSQTFKNLHFNSLQFHIKFLLRNFNESLDEQFRGGF